MTLYAQNVLGYSPTEAGLALVPSSLAIVLASKAAPRFMRALGERNVAVLGTLVAVAGFAWQSTMSVDGDYVVTIMIPGILMMLGAGLATTPLAALATSGAAPGEAGLVSGLVNTSRTMGGSLGLAVMSTLAAARTAGSTGREALTEGYALVFRTGAGVLVGGAVLMWVWLPRRVPAGVSGVGAAPVVGDVAVPVSGEAEDGVEEGAEREADAEAEVGGKFSGE
jgi:Na+/melibiose symporter-like transporter